MKRILIFGGTKDGRLLAESLMSKGNQVFVSVATTCGKEQLMESERLKVLVGRLTVKEMEQLLEKLKLDVVVDATHPYATEVTQNIKLAVKSIPYYRLLRKNSEVDYGEVVESIAEACSLIGEGNVLATTGSKQVKEYVSGFPRFKEQLYVRVLPTEDSIEACRKAGLEQSHILTKLGVSTVEENIQIINQYQIRTLITKDGGITGGFPEKCSACKETGIRLIIIKRPTEEVGYSIEELENILDGE